MGETTQAPCEPLCPEGWYFDCETETCKEYSGYKILFDFSKIRPAGSEISGGFKAPGSNGLMQSLDKVNNLLESACKTSDKISSICAYDIVMHMADAVLSGGK